MEWRDRRYHICLSFIELKNRHCLLDSVLKLQASSSLAHYRDIKRYYCRLFCVLMGPLGDSNVVQRQINQCIANKHAPTIAFVQAINIDSTPNVGIWIKRFSCYLLFCLGHLSLSICFTNGIALSRACARFNEILSPLMCTSFCVRANKFDKTFSIEFGSNKTYQDKCAPDALICEWLTDKIFCLLLLQWNFVAETNATINCSHDFAANTFRLSTGRIWIK